MATTLRRSTRVGDKRTRSPVAKDNTPNPARRTRRRFGDDVTNTSAQQAVVRRKRDKESRPQRAVSTALSKSKAKVVVEPERKLWVGGNFHQSLLTREVVLFRLALEGTCYTETASKDVTHVLHDGSLLSQAAVSQLKDLPTLSVYDIPVLSKAVVVAIPDGERKNERLKVTALRFAMTKMGVSWTKAVDQSTTHVVTSLPSKFNLSQGIRTVDIETLQKFVLVDVQEQKVQSPPAMCVEDVGPAEMTLKWPIADDQLVDDYVVYTKVGDGAWDCGSTVKAHMSLLGKGTFVQVSSLGFSESTFAAKGMVHRALCGLKSDTEYSFMVCSLLKGEQGPSSDIVSRTTLREDDPSNLPGQSDEVWTSDVSQNSMVVHWNTPACGADRILKYHVYFKEKECKEEEEMVVVPARKDDVASQRRFSRLRPGTYYSFFVVPVNVYGEGHCSETITAQTQGTRRSQRPTRKDCQEVRKILDKAAAEYMEFRSVTEQKLSESDLFASRIVEAQGRRGEVPLHRLALFQHTQLEAARLSAQCSEMYEKYQSDVAAYDELVALAGL